MRFTSVVAAFCFALLCLFIGCSRTELSPATDFISNGDAGGDGGEGGRDGGDAGDGGPPRVCRVNGDCDDKNQCTTDRCVSGVCRSTARDDDGDGVVANGCGGQDCNDNDPNVRPGTRESCVDGVDNDCDGRTDCDDSDCNGQSGCACQGGELCGNGIDDDCDGKTDCEDFKCSGLPQCSCQTFETCGNNFDDDCNGLTDCDDPACQGGPSCSCNRPEICDNGRDENCNGLFDCDDPQCSGTPVCTCSSNPEDCENGQDDNCNGLVDCVDPACTGIGSCACQNPVTENCGNGVDDDCDGLRDCQDPECIGTPSCTQCSQEVCNDNFDNDCDGKIDCADDACAFATNCANKPEVCNNGIDDDRDTKIDCNDTDCSTNPLCTTQHKNCLTPKPISASGSFTGDTTGFVGEQSGSCGGAAGEAVFALTLTAPSKVVIDTIGTSFDSTLYIRTGACKAGRELACDDDSGGSHAAKIVVPIMYPGTYYIFVDGFTVDPNLGPDQGPYTLNVAITPNPTEVCNNGIDDDGDRLTDCADPNCATVAPCSTCRGGQPGQKEMGIGACTDGIDNDCDGKVDCADDDCHATDSRSGVPECCNGIDDNGNDIVDEFACRCTGAGTCGGGFEICYTDTIFSCGPPCTGFVGDVCPFVAPGSTCNRNNGQCEFP